MHPHYRAEEVDLPSVVRVTPRAQFVSYALIALSAPGAPLALRAFPPRGSNSRSGALHLDEASAWRRRRHGLGRIVAIPPVQRTNSMPMSVRSTSAMLSRPRPARQRAHRQPLRRDRRTIRTSTRAQAGRPLHVHRPHVDGHAAARADRRDLPRHVLSPRRAARRCAASTTVNTTRPGITLVAPGGFEPAYRSNQLRHARAAPFDREHALGRGGERVLPPRLGTVPAWPAMPRISTIRRLAPLIAVTTPTGKPSRLEHRSLLDVQLDIGEDLLAPERRPRDARRIEPEGRERIAHRHVLRVDLVEHRGVERCRRPRGRRAASCRSARPPRRRSPRRRHREGSGRRRAASACTHSIAVPARIPSYLPASRARCRGANRASGTATRAARLRSARRNCRSDRAAPAFRPRASSRARVRWRRAARRSGRCA